MEKSATVLILCGFLVIAKGQITYENHLPAINRLHSLATSVSQEEVGRLLAESLARVNVDRLLSVLSNYREPRHQRLLDGHGSTVHMSEDREAAGDSAGVKIGAQCFADVMAFVQHLNHTPPEVWALKMADATGKPNAGILSGRFLFLGDFDQCRDIQAQYKSAVLDASAGREFKGQYCLGKYSINFPSVPREGNYRWAMCVPDSCTESDALQIGNLALKLYNVTLIRFEKMDCNMRHVPWTARAIGVFAMVGVIVFLVLVGTAVDILLIQLPKWRVVREVREDLGENFNERPVHRPFDAPKRRRDMLGGGDDSEPLIVNEGSSEVKVQKPKSHVPRVIEILAAFSAWSNIGRLLSTKQPPGTLTCLNGIRVISINWVLLGHSVLNLSFAGDNLAAYSKEAFKRWTFQVILNGTFSVDSFLVLSGLLVSYMTLKQMRRTGGRNNWLKFYVHRYLRLTPLYMISMGIYLTTLPYLVNGPMFPQKTGFEPDHFCEHNWWGNLLYVQNLVKFKPNYCLGWAWYLAVDMQLYVISPLLIIPLFYRPKIGYIISALFFLMTTVTPFVLTEMRYYTPGNVPDTNFHKPLGDKNYDLYIAPYCRMGPYLAGMLCGYVLYRLNDRPVKMSRPLVAAGWAASSATILAALYGLIGYFRGDELSLHVSALYNAFSRTAWGVSLVWIIFACVTGYGGVVNTILSWSAWVPMARLTYAVYLVHSVILMVWVSTARVPFYMTDWTVVQVYLALLLMAHGVAFLCYILFEAPIMGLEKALVNRRKKN